MRRPGGRSRTTEHEIPEAVHVEPVFGPTLLSCPAFRSARNCEMVNRGGRIELKAISLANKADREIGFLPKRALDVIRVHPADLEVHGSTHGHVSGSHPSGQTTSSEVFRKCHPVELGIRRSLCAFVHDQTVPFQNLTSDR